MISDTGKVVVVGGGTAGWLTAMYSKAALGKYNYDVCVVESSDIGILGAGEGTSPVFLSMLGAIGISPFDVIKQCGGTVKSGIKFVNWSFSDFFNPFLSNEFCEPDFFFPEEDTFYSKYTDYSFLYGKLSGWEHECFLFPDRVASKNCVPIGFKPSGPDDAFDDLRNTFESFSNWALHFDAKKLAAFLKKEALNRGISLIDSKVLDLDTDNDGYIKSINLENGNQVPCDFVFDCTGFARLIIGKFYNSEWISYKNKLSVDRAIPFFKEIDCDIPPYTKSIAMNAGWVWEIPTQDRFGCGYVFNSDCLTDEEASSEISNYLGKQFEPEKAFSFDAGTYRNVWIKNVMSAGLAASFVEPLEATSLIHLIIQIKRFLSDPLNIKCRNQKIIDKFNKSYLEDAEEIVDYIQLHYLGSGNTGEFWDNFKKTKNVSTFLQEIIEICYFRQPNADDFDKKNVFKLKSYLPILHGLNMISNDALLNSISTMTPNRKEHFLNLIKNHSFFEDMCIHHNEFIEYLKGE